MNNATNILSIILALVIGLTGMCGSVPADSQPVSVEAGITVEGDLSILAAASGAFGSAGSETGEGSEGSEGNDQVSAIMNAVKSLLSALTVRFAVDSSAAQMEILLNGAPAVSLSAKAEDDGWAAVSSLFPSSVLTVKNETMQAMSGSIAQGIDLSSIDKDAVAEAVKAPVEQLIDGFKATAGEAETGSWTVGGTEYTSKVPYNVTTKEAVEMVLETVKAILSDERVAGLAAMLGDSASPEQLEEALASIKDRDESELPVLSAVEYSNEAGDTCVELNLANEEQSMGMLIASAGQVTKVDLDAMGQLTLSLVIDQENRQYDLTAAFISETVAMNITGSLKATDDRSDFIVSAAIPVGETPITFGIRGTIGHDAPVFETAEGQKTLELESIMADEEAAGTFAMEIQAGLMTLLGTVMQQFPELSALMMGSQGTGAPVGE